MTNLSPDKIARTQQALNETITVLNRALGYSPDLRDDELINILTSHIDTLTKRTTLLLIDEDGMDRKHNSLYDRGAADSYYGRRQDPHYYIGVSRIESLSEEQIAEYRLGYSENTDYKDWG